MRFRKAVASFILFTFGMSATQLGSVTGGRKQMTARDASASRMHRSNCCCPSLCNRPKPQVKENCHKPQARSTQKETDSSVSCVLKAGCTRSDERVSPSVKDFLFEPSEALRSALRLSSLTISLLVSMRMGFLPTPFHPPKIT
jgi:hypothetical protein